MPAVAGAASLLSNSDFDTDLGSWTTSGAVQHSTDFAVLTDAVGSASIDQSAPEGSGAYSFAVDFIGGLSGQGVLLDSAFFSIYLGDNPFVSPTSPGSFDEVITLFDLDAIGVSNSDPEVSVAPHPTRVGWSRASVNFTTSRTNITPHVQLLDQNGIASDSSVGVDRFELMRIPEPSSMSLFCVAGWFFLTSRRKKN